MPLDEHEIAAVLLAGRVKEMVETDVVERRRGSEARDKIQQDENVGKKENFWKLLKKTFTILKYCYGNVQYYRNNYKKFFTQHEDMEICFTLRINQIKSLERPLEPFPSNL